MARPRRTRDGERRALLEHRLVQRVVRRASWRIVVPLLRALARRRLGSLREGVTVVTVNWNSRDVLDATLAIVQRRSPPGTHIQVVDNGSIDGSRAYLRRRRDVRSVLSPVNLDHGLAMDLGFLLCRTTHVVALDVDAFPLREGWLEELLGPLDHGAHVSGARLWRPYVHPCCLAMRTERFVREGHSFRAHYIPHTEDAIGSGDVAESISQREAGHLHFLEITDQRGPSDVGTVFGDLIYHNFYGTRFNRGQRVAEDVTPSDAKNAWSEALAKFG